VLFRSFALYEKGVRNLWVLTEYQSVSVSDDGRTLRIGTSSLSYDDDGFTMVVKDKTAPWGRPLEATLRFAARTKVGPELTLVDGLSHRWQPICIRGEAHVEVPSHDFALAGRGYHDGNHGEVALGTDVTGWDWVRTHHHDRTTVSYRVRGATDELDVLATSSDVTARRAPGGRFPTVRSGWGLQVPSQLGVGEELSLLESSPFYARLEAGADGVHALGEVADFARFHRPSLRWMASLRTRYEKGTPS
jgi:carotenoid 1,2-hydratase